MHYPLVSIIIPTYNRAHLIGETLESVKEQTYKNWECIVIDDGSSDYTDELMGFYCKNDPRIQYHHRPDKKTKGANACRNYGFSLCKGKYVKWFDSDDILLPDYLLFAIDRIEETNCDGVVCDYYYSNLDLQANSLITCELLMSWFFDFITGRISINIANVIWRRELVKNLEFDESLFRAQELDFHFKIFNRNPKIKMEYLNKSLVNVINHENSITGTYFKGEKKSVKSEYIVRKKIFEHVSVHYNNTEDFIIVCNSYAKALYLYSLKESTFRIYNELSSLKGYFKKSCFRKWLLIYLKYLLISKIFKTRNFRLRKHSRILYKCLKVQ